MIVITVARKPFSESTASLNVLEHGTGSLNIEGTRVGLPEDKRAAGTRAYQAGRHAGGCDGTGDLQDAPHDGKGRWPANLVLEHLPGCQEMGVKRVKPSNGSGRASSRGHGFRSDFVGGEKKDEGFGGGSVEADGMETVTAWECALGCPVAALDQQTGTLVSGTPVGMKHGLPGVFTGMNERLAGTPVTGYGDTGGASRFFKQVQGHRK